MVWSGIEKGMWKMPEWSGMEDLKTGMEDKLPYFLTSCILDFVDCIYRKTFTDSDKQYSHRSIIFNIYFIISRPIAVLRFHVWRKQCHKYKFSSLYFPLKFKNKCG